MSSAPVLSSPVRATEIRATQQATAAALVPLSVSRAYWLLMLALAAGVAEAGVQVGTLLGSGAAVSSVLAQVTVRLGVYGAVLLVMSRFLRGAAWARAALVVGLGVVGLASLVMEPLTWLADGHTIGDAWAARTLDGGAITLARVVHIGAVLVAVPLMLSRATTRYVSPRA